MDGFAQMSLSYRPTVPVEELAINFESVRQRLIWNRSLESSFDYLEKCARTANRGRGAETQRLRPGGKIGALQEFCSAFQACFRFVFA